MSLYRHPHLTRGVMHTPEGAFRINRGLVELPDELGESLGWAQVEAEDTVPPGFTAVRRPDPHEDLRAGRR